MEWVVFELSLIVAMLGLVGWRLNSRLRDIATAIREQWEEDESDWY